MLLYYLRRIFFWSSLTFILLAMVPFTLTDPKLLKYQKDFLELDSKYCPQRNRALFQKTIIFKKLQGETIGVCTEYLTGFIITIDPDYWKTATDIERYSTMVHEMTHCYLGLHHSDDKTNYMYFAETNVPLEVVNKQLIFNMVTSCN